MIQLSKDNNYTLYKVEKDNSFFLRLVSNSSRHSSDHYSVNIIYKDKRSTEPITEQLVPLIIERFQAKGPTLAFDIYDKEFSIDSKDVSNILHQETRSEKSFTSTGDKIDHHWPIFKKLAETGYGSIIRATLTLHQKCSSRCAFCSTINRSESDSITFEEAKDFIDKLYFDQAKFNEINFPEYNNSYKNLTGSPIRLRSVILSGGGQPNLWPHFEKLVEYISNLDIDLGLITNGFPKPVSESIYSNFTWIRVSVTPPEASSHYIDGKFEKQYIPSTIFDKSITKGLSYVYGPWAQNDIYKRLDDFAVNNDFKYVRLLCDCNLPRDQQLESHSELSDVLSHNDLIDVDGSPTSRVFHQLKYHMKHDEADEIWDDGKCFLQTYNVFWDTSGHDQDGYSYCYPCDSVTVLAEDSQDDFVQPERGFNHKKWGTVNNKNVESLFTEQWHSFFDPRENCKSCLFHRNNRKVKDLTSKFSINPDFVPTLNPFLDHVNFP